MDRDTPRISEDEPVELLCRPQGYVSLHRGAVVAIRRALLDPEGLQSFVEALEAARSSHPRGLVLLAAFRLDPRYPLPATFDHNLSVFAAALRRIDNEMAAIASLLEFGGVRATAMELTSRAVWTLGRPSAKMKSFRSLGDAAQWLAEVGPEVGAPDDPSVYVRMYRHNDRRLRALDALEAEARTDTED